MTDEEILKYPILDIQYKKLQWPSAGWIVQTRRGRKVPIVNDRVVGGYTIEWLDWEEVRMEAL